MSQIKKQRKPYVYRGGTKDRNAVITALDRAIEKSKTHIEEKDDLLHT
jgi:hypothetical protein